MLQVSNLLKNEESLLTHFISVRNINANRRFRELKCESPGTEMSLQHRFIRLEILSKFTN
jgi:hypothetical protein